MLSSVLVTFSADIPVRDSLRSLWFAALLAPPKEAQPMRYLKLSQVFRGGSFALVN